MRNLIAQAKQALQTALDDACRASFASPPPEGAAIEIPKEEAFGDLSATIAMPAARLLKKPPRAIAEGLAAACAPHPYFTPLQIAGPGYLNTTFTDAWYGALLDAIGEEGPDYGSSALGQGKRVMVEFVSANPTGPMTIGNARGGVLGDTLAAVLQKAGYDVWREFYLNDAGHQVELMGRSLEARYLGLPVPEDGYHGDDIQELVQAYRDQNGPSLTDKSPEQRRKALVDFALPRNVNKMREDLRRYGIQFDRFFAESELHNSGYVDDTLQKLSEAGCTYEKDGALWLDALRFGAEKDEVLRKSNGFLTYYAVDIAYHRDKLEKRGFDEVIDVLGADHHGHAVRFRTGLAALNLPPEKLRFCLMQMVRLTRDGETVRMSKRTGKAITLSDLLDEIPVDAARFFFNRRPPDTHLEFDMALAVRQNSDNPVYYVQYAHARIHSLLKELGFTPGQTGLYDGQGNAIAALLQTPHEKSLMKALAMYPEEIRLAALSYEPSRVNNYLVELAGTFHRFYNHVRIKDGDPALIPARAALCDAVRCVLSGGLTLLGISAPEKM